MVSRDYTKEIGVDSGNRLVSKPVAIAILAVAMVIGWFTLRPLVESAKSPHVSHPPAVAH